MDDLTNREVSRELARLSGAIETLTTTMSQDFVRKDVYQSDLRSVQNDVAELKSSRRAQAAAITAMLLSILGGFLTFLLTRGFGT